MTFCPIRSDRKTNTGSWSISCWCNFDNSKLQFIPIFWLVLVGCNLKSTMWIFQLIKNNPALNIVFKRSQRKENYIYNQSFLSVSNIVLCFYIDDTWNTSLLCNFKWYTASWLNQKKCSWWVYLKKKLLSWVILLKEHSSFSSNYFNSIQNIYY